MSLEYLRRGFRYLIEYWLEAACVVVGDNACSMDSNRSLGSLRVRTGRLGAGDGAAESSEEATATGDAKSLSTAGGFMKFKGSGFSVGEVTTMRDGDALVKPRNSSSTPVFELGLSNSGGGDASPSVGVISPRLKFDCPPLLSSGDLRFENGGGGGGGPPGPTRPRICRPPTFDSDLENCCAPRPRANTTDFTMGLDGYMIGNHAGSRTLSASRNSSPIYNSQRTKLRNGDGLR